MAEEENIAGELHGHLTQMLRTAMSGGLQVTEQRARRLQQEAEAERRAAMENARQLDERKRAELEMNVLLAQQRRDRQDTERAVDRAVETNGSGGTSADAGATAFPKPVEDALGAAHQGTVEHSAKPCHQRDRGATNTTTLER